MKIKYLLFFVPLVFTSCAIYKQNFDCPPDVGVPCTSVSDLEQMIVETDEGPHIFLGVNPNQSHIESTPYSKKIWIPDHTGRGHYIYLQEGSCLKP